MSEVTDLGSVLLSIYEKHRQIASFELERPTEIGRRQANEPAVSKYRVIAAVVNQE